MKGQLNYQEVLRMLSKEEKESVVNLLEIGASFFLVKLLDNPHKFDTQDVLTRRDYMNNLIKKLQESFK